MSENQLNVKTLFNRDDVKQKFTDILGKRAASFTTSVLQIVAQNSELSKADPTSIYHSAAVAATLDLPLNNNLGFAYIIPYNKKHQDSSGVWKTKQVAQFQMGYKGFIQLAQRSGQFQTLDAKAVYEGQVIEDDSMFGGKIIKWSAKTSNTIIGYAAYFKLLNGFEKTLYMSIEDLRKHSVKYSKTFSSKSGLWNTEFEAMALKTVLKLLLSKYAPLSIEMQKAVITDQSLINNEDATDITYIDNDPTAAIENNHTDKKTERICKLIDDCKNEDDLRRIKDEIPEEYMEFYETKLFELTSLATATK